jgi:transposase
MPAAKPEEFRRRAVELARLGEKPVAEIAEDPRGKASFTAPA